MSATVSGPNSPVAPASAHIWVPVAGQARARDPAPDRDPAPERDPAPDWAAVVLAGGRARRLGGADKPAAEVGGRPLLDRVLGATSAASAVVVVGPPRPVGVGRPVQWVLEDPPGSGPLAGLAAGLAAVRAPLVAVLAADLPFLTAADLACLRAAATGGSADGAEIDGALLVDPSGRAQLLAAVWRTPALRAAMPPAPVGMPVRALLTASRVVRVPATGRTCLDCDTPADLAAARALAAGDMTSVI